MHAPARSLPRLAAPLVISFTLRFLFQTVDLVYAAYVGDAAGVAAIGLWSPLQAVMIAIWVGLSAGFTATLAAAFGSRDESRIVALKRAMVRILCWLVPLLTTSGVVMWFLVPRLGLEARLADAFRIYATTLCFGLPLVSFWSIYPDSIVKAHHDMRSTMIAGFVSTISNVILNTLFVFGFGLGIFGIALATVLSRISALIYAMRRARILEAARLADAAPAKLAANRAWPRPPLRAILLLSIPGSAAFALSASELAIVHTLLLGLPDSTEAIAAFATYTPMLMLALTPAIGVSVAVVPYVARAAAEGRLAAVASDLRRTIYYTAVASMVFAVPAGLLFPEQIGGYFVGRGAPAGAEASAAVPAGAITILRLLPLAALASLPFTILRPVFEALDRPRLGVIVSVLRFVGFSLPAIWLGKWIAESASIEPLVGIVVGTIVAAAAASWTTAFLAQRLRRTRTTTRGSDRFVD